MNNEEHTDELGSILFHTFERMGPSAEAEDRMMNALVAAQATKEGAPETDEETVEVSARDNAEQECAALAEGDDVPEAAFEAEAAFEPEADAEAELDTTPDAPENDAAAPAFVPATAILEENGPNTESYRKARRVWHVALPAAACLALCVGIGVLAISTNTLMGANPETLASQERADSSAPADVAVETSQPPAPDAVPAPSPLNVTLSDGTQLRIATDESGAARGADATLVGAQIEVTSAWNDAQERLGCTVFAYNDSAHPYAVRYDNTESFYLADFA